MTAATLVSFFKKHPVGSACLVVILVCGGLLYYRADAIAVSQAEYEAKSAEATKMNNNVKAAPGLAEQLAEIQGHAKDLESRLVRGDQLAVNLQYFYKLEADNGVKLLDVRQNAPVSRRGGKTIFAPVPFTLTVQGSYVQLVKFLGQLQNGQHLCRINSASFTKSGGGGDGTMFAPDITLSLNLELLGQS